MPRGKLQFNEEHDHKYDYNEPRARFFGKNTHDFAEADDHFHEESNGGGNGISPHDLHNPGSRCSSCGHGF